MEALKTIPYIFIILAISGIIAGASMLSVSKFSTTMQQCEWTNSTYADSNGNVWNTTLQGGLLTSTACVRTDAKNETSSNMTKEYYASRMTASGLGDVSEQFPTIGIIAIMVIIISLIAGVFVYMRMFA